MLKSCKPLRAPGLFRRITTAIPGLFGLLCAATLLAQAASAQTLFILTNDGQLATLQATDPAVNTAPVPITGITAGETLVAIDLRPQTQRLYALGVNATADTATLYHISPETGYAFVIGTPSSIAYVDESSNPIDFPDPAVATWDIDFNPGVDRLRIVTSTGLNMRVNPNTGAPIDGDSSTPATTNPDGFINGGTTTVHGTAYTNSQPSPGLTTQYTVDAATNSLFIQSPPNNGTQSSAVAITLSGAPFDFSDVRGFDIAPGVNAPGANQPVAAGSAIFIATASGTTSLYSLNLVNGQATLLGTPALAIRSAAIASQIGLAYALAGTGTSLLRFDPSNPGTPVSTSITGIASGETLVGIDIRPQSGQLFALGVNAAANTATLYSLDPISAAATAIGTPGQIAYVDASGNPVDLPDPSLGYGFDFNPTVDRIRIVTGTGLNMRVNPSTGLPVDGDTVTPGVNPDGALNVGGVTAIGVTATAYTNNFGRDTGGAGGVTTQYSLNTIAGILYIQNPPNAGTLVNPIALELSNLGTLTGFDIPASVTVSASNQLASGLGWLLVQQGATSDLYRINLATGALFNAGTVTGASAAGLVVLSTPPPITLAADRITVTGGVTRINPLANDGLDASATIVSVSDPAITIQGRSLILPAGFTGTFTYEVSTASSTGIGTVVVAASPPAADATRFGGLLYNEAGTLAGFASVAISANDVASIQLVGGTESTRAKATFATGSDTATAFTKAGSLTLVRNASGTIEASLAALGGTLTGTLRAAASTATAQKHHIALASTDAALQGGGFAIATTSAKGAVAIRGTLPDGLAFSTTGTLSDSGTVAFYSVVRKGANPPATLGGELFIADLATTDITGELLYIKPPQAGTKGLHLAGVNTTLTANGSLYAGQLDLDGDGTLRLTGGNLAADEEAPVAIAEGIPATPTGSLTSWTGVKAKTGTFTAKVTVPDVNKPVTGRGIYLPKSNRAWGFFPGTTVGGRIELSVP